MLVRPRNTEKTSAVEEAAETAVGNLLPHRWAEAVARDFIGARLRNQHSSKWVTQAKQRALWPRIAAVFPVRIVLQLPDGSCVKVTSRSRNPRIAQKNARQGNGQLHEEY